MADVELNVKQRLALGDIEESCLFIMVGDSLREATVWAEKKGLASNQWFFINTHHDLPKMLVFNKKGIQQESSSSSSFESLTPYDFPKTVTEEAMFPLLKEIYLAGVKRGESHQFSQAELGKQALAEAFDRGAECMADQINEDFFGGQGEFKAEFENLYSYESSLE